MGVGAGELDASEIGFDAFEQLRRGVHGTLARCSHVGRLALDKAGHLPKPEKLPTCGHRQLSLLFIMDPVAEVGDVIGSHQLNHILHDAGYQCHRHHLLGYVKEDTQWREHSYQLGQMFIPCSIQPMPIQSPASLHQASALCNNQAAAVDLPKAECWLWFTPVAGLPSSPVP